MVLPWAIPQKDLVTFKAGRMNLNEGNLLVPDPKKGLIRLVQIKEKRIFFWIDRKTNVVELQFEVPKDKGQIEVKKVTQCTTGRVLLFEFMDGRKYFFWFQEPEPEEDDKYFVRTKFYIEDVSIDYPEEVYYNSEGYSSETPDDVDGAESEYEEEREIYSDEDTDSEFVDDSIDIPPPEEKTDQEIQDKLDALEKMEQQSEETSRKRARFEPQVEEETFSPLLEKDNTQKIPGLNTKFREDCLKRLEASLQRNFSTCQVSIDNASLQQISIHAEYGCFFRVLTSTCRMKNIYKSNVATLLSKINSKTKSGQIYDYDSDVEAPPAKRQKQI